MKFTDIVKVDGIYYLVDSCFTFDCGFETMIFMCNDDGKVIDWCDLYVEHYNTKSEMEIRHYEIVSELEKGLIL